MKVSESISFEGGRTCGKTQVMSLDDLFISLPSANVWCCLQNNNNNAYYFSLADGSYNNNNKNNQNWVVPVEPKDMIDLVFQAESDCWRNKHSSWDAAKYHYHTGLRLISLAISIGDGSYKPYTSMCFLVLYPRLREVFAAFYQDRIVHHIAAPYIRKVSEVVHTANGNVSFGNRKGMSAWHACLRVQAMMRKHPNGYIRTYDISSFFMSIDKQTCWEVFLRYEEKYRPDGYSAGERLVILRLIKQMLFHNPASDCVRRTPESKWDDLPKSKSLFYMNGLPIGNFYCQQLANLYLAPICELMIDFDITEFVDDFILIADSMDEIREADKQFHKGADKLKLNVNENKCYIQKVWAGVLWCGYFIKIDRIYTSNRPIKNCFYKIRNTEPTLDNAKDILNTVNSYIGMLCHCAEHNTQMRICEEVTKRFGEWLYFRKKSGRIVCTMKKRYTKRNLSKLDIEYIDYNLTKKEVLL